MMSILKKISLLLMATVFMAGTINGQNDDVTYVPPSPDAAALLEYSSVSVNLYNGIPKVEYPLFELPGRQAKIPISISYHASGIKVQDVSSSVGLGWTLNAGGVVTRVVRGMPDEHTKGFFNLPVNTTEDEPDVYYFNFLGHGGKIILDRSVSPMQLPEQNYLITAPVFTATNPLWEFTDLSGIKYVFGKTSSSRETTTTKLKNEGTDKLRTYISTWFLSEVIYPTKKETVTFTYSSGSNVYFEGYRQIQGKHQPGQMIAAACGNPPLLAFGATDRITEITVNAPKYISSISTTLGTASFTYATDRQDITNARRLSRIDINSSYNVRRFEFVNNVYFSPSGCSSAICKRMKLSKVNDVTNGTLSLYQEFFYNETDNLPARNSVQYDHWGYYNLNSYSTAIPTVVDGFGNSYPGADKSPNLSRTTANVLKKVVNGSGGIQEFEYSLNQYVEGGVSYNTGGLRIAKITEDDGFGNKVIRNYKYFKYGTTQSSGIIYRKSRYHYEQKVYNMCSQNHYDSQGRLLFTTTHQYGNSAVIIYSSSLIDQYDVGGLHVGYADVQVEYANGSKELNFFHNFQDRPDDPATFLAPPGVTHEDFTHPDGPPFISRGDRSYERGLLKEQIFVGADGKKKSRIVNTFDFYLASTRKITGSKNMNFWWISNCPGGCTSIYGKNGTYTYYHRGVRLIRSVEETYDENDETKKTTKDYSYTYNPYFSNLISERIQQFSDGSFEKNQKRYPLDYFNGTPPTSTSSDLMYDALYLMCTKKMFDVPIEEIAWTKATGSSTYLATNVVLNTYKRNAATNNPVRNITWQYPLTMAASYTPRYLYMSSFGIPYPSLDKVIHNTYDAYDNPTRVSTNSGLTNYEWGHNATLVTAMSQVIGGVTQRTAYTYRPLIGITSIVDPNGRSTTFEYDTHNRLRLIKDHDGSIVKQFRYHQRYQDESITATIGFPSCAIKGSPVTISAGGNTLDGYGETTYTFNFGDGTSATTTSSSVSHTYASAGTYTVNVTRSNPEYGSATASVTSQVCGPITHGVCADGKVLIDLCNSITLPSGSCTTQTNTTILKSNASGGCGTLAYRWEYKSSGETSWSLLASTANASPPQSFLNRSVCNYQVRCIISDACSSVTSQEISLAIFKAGCQ